MTLSMGSAKDSIPYYYSLPLVVLLLLLPPPPPLISETISRRRLYLQSQLKLDV